MNNGRIEEQLIEQFKNEFREKTGKYIKISYTLKSYESTANFSESVEFWKLVKCIFDCTGWTKNDTFKFKKNGARGRTIGSTDERTFRRGLIDYIAVNNGCKAVDCARLTKRDHTTVGHSLKTFEARLDTEPHTRKVLTEVVHYLRDNYHLYKSRVINESDVE